VVSVNQDAGFSIVSYTGIQVLMLQWSRTWKGTRFYNFKIEFADNWVLFHHHRSYIQTQL
jgi:hypothetical protein